MVMSVPVNTYNALQNAHINGIVPRDFVWISALNTTTDLIENIGLWSGSVPVTVNVIQPSDGATVSRVYQGFQRDCRACLSCRDGGGSRCHGRGQYRPSGGRHGQYPT